MFSEFVKYKKPIIEVVNKNCTVATYYPENEGEVIIGINTYNNNTVYLYNTTLINITSNTVLKLLNTLPKIKNKKVSKKQPKKKSKKRA